MIDHIVCQKTTMPKKTDNDWTPILDVVVVIFYHLLLIVCGGKLLYISTIMDNAHPQREQRGERVLAHWTPATRGISKQAKK